MKKVCCFLGVFLFTMAARTAEPGWVARVVCENGAFVVDGLHSWERGFTDHQAVIRHSGTIVHFQHLVEYPLHINEKSEVIVSSLGPEFSGDFKAPLATQATRGSGMLKFELHGHWVARNSYELYITRAWCGPGSCEPEGSFLGNWIFNDCHWEPSRARH